jgi:hypothetical protein
MPIDLSVAAAKIMALHVVQKFKKKYSYDSYLLRLKIDTNGLNLQ